MCKVAPAVQIHFFEPRRWACGSPPPPPPIAHQISGAREGGKRHFIRAYLLIWPNMYLDLPLLQSHSRHKAASPNAQKIFQKILPLFASNKKLFCYAKTEPDVQQVAFMPF